MFRTHSRSTLAALVALAGFGFAASAAEAASARVRWYCATDYLRYCSQHPEEGDAVRRCMSAHGMQLSQGCVDALVAAGEVSRAEVARRLAAGK
jgi:hypothetical protein